VPLYYHEKVCLYSIIYYTEGMVHTLVVPVDSFISWSNPGNDPQGKQTWHKEDK